MGTLIQSALLQGTAILLLLFVFAPLLLLLLVCMVFIAAASMREWLRFHR